MNETETARQGRRGIYLIQVLLLFGVAANLLLAVKLDHNLRVSGQTPPRRPDLPCAAIPTRFIMQEPVCAQKLIEAMNVTNVRVVANSSQTASFRWNESAALWRQNSVQE